jgi:dTDP-4-amino-4,6-dideoxy-D-glucose transaminase
LRHTGFFSTAFTLPKHSIALEGGAVIGGSAEIKLRIDRLKNFGLVNEVTVVEPGINGKMNEFQAALGLIQLKHIAGAIARRKLVHERYQWAILIFMAADRRAGEPAARRCERARQRARPADQYRSSWP